MARRGLQTLVVLLGTVAVVFGGLSVVTGAGYVWQAGDVSASVDSEFRFYAAWYVGAGVILLSTVRRLESAGSAIRLVCAVLWLGACGRLLSLVTVGPPDRLYLILMAVEFGIPVILVPWQAWVAGRARQPSLRTEPSGESG
ncbi:MAG: DUF4345 domain-containing protein [Micromonosporaceae bacterium]